MTRMAIDARQPLCTQKRTCSSCQQLQTAQHVLVVGQRNKTRSDCRSVHSQSNFRKGERVGCQNYRCADNSQPRWPWWREPTSRQNGKSAALTKHQQILICCSRTPPPWLDMKDPSIEIYGGKGDGVKAVTKEVREYSGHTSRQWQGGLKLNPDSMMTCPIHAAHALPGRRERRDRAGAH